MCPDDLHVEVGQPGGDPEGHARHLGLLHCVLQQKVICLEITFQKNEKF